MVTKIQIFLGEKCCVFLNIWAVFPHHQHRPKLQLGYISKNELWYKMTWGYSDSETAFIITCPASQSICINGKVNPIQMASCQHFSRLMEQLMLLMPQEALIHIPLLRLVEFHHTSCCFWHQESDIFSNASKTFMPESQVLTKKVSTPCDY